MRLPKTHERVPRHTKPQINERIHDKLKADIRYYAEHPEDIDQRLAEIDKEWDVERTLEANASTLALIGLGLGTLVHRRLYLLSGAVLGFLLQHALQGWCPPLPFLRRLGFRTQTEMEAERTALQEIRKAAHSRKGKLSRPQVNRLISDTVDRVNIAA